MRCNTVRALAGGDTGGPGFVLRARSPRTRGAPNKDCVTTEPPGSPLRPYVSVCQRRAHPPFDQCFLTVYPALASVHRGSVRPLCPVVSTAPMGLTAHPPFKGMNAPARRESERTSRPSMIQATGRWAWGTGE